MKLKYDDISRREGWWKLGPTENLVGGGGAPCASGTKLRILDPEKGDCFAAGTQMTVTGAELAASSQSLISCNKTDSVSLTLDFACGETERYPRTGNERAWTSPSPSGPRFPMLAEVHRSLSVLEGRKERKSVPEGSGGQVTALTLLSPVAAFDRPAASPDRAGSLRFPLSL